LLPCQNSALGISFTLLHCNRKVGTDIFALTAAYTVVNANRFALYLIVERQHFFRAYSDTEAAPLAPLFIDDNAETFCQETHLPLRTFLCRTSA